MRILIVDDETFLAELVKLALDSSTDLKLSDETGKCEQLSSTLAISAAPAFVRR